MANRVSILFLLAFLGFVWAVVEKRQLNETSAAVCGIPPPGENVVEIPTANISYPEVFTYKCEEGFQTSTTLLNQCQSDGLWSLPVGPRCLGVICCDLPAGDNTKNLPAKVFRYPDSYTYRCNDGYEAVSENMKTSCQPDGKWSLATPPVCQGVSCCSPPLGVNTDEIPTKKYRHPDVYTYECNAGFVSNYTMESQCQADGTWSLPEAPECTGIVCGIPPPIENTKNATVGDISYPNAYTYTCEDGFEPSTVMSIQCQSDGKWSSQTDPTCTADVNVDVDVNGGCASNPCGNGGTCTDTADGVQCECTEGCQGQLCLDKPTDYVPGSRVYQDGYSSAECDDGYYVSECQCVGDTCSGSWMPDTRSCEAFSTTNNNVDIVHAKALCSSKCGVF